ncbi:unnamed protein product, partial [marine sediment metagenome]
MQSSPELNSNSSKEDLKKKYGNRISIWIPSLGIGDTI